jgi:O-antigen ligase
MIAIASLAALLTAAWSVTVGSRYLGLILYVYVAALVTMPTIAFQILGQEVPVGLSDLLLAAVLVAAVGATGRSEALPLHLRSLGRWLIVFNLAILLSIAFIPIVAPSASPTGSLLRFVRLLATVALFFAYTRLAPDQTHARRLVRIATAAIVCQASLGLLSFFLQVPMLVDSERKAEQYLWLEGGGLMTRAQGTVGESSSLAHLAAIGCLLAMFSLGVEKGLRVWLAVGAILVCVSCIVVTYSRGLLLGLVLGTVVFVILTKRRAALKVLGAAAGVLLVLLMLHASGIGFVSSLLRRLAFVPQVTTSLSADAYLTGRIGLWAQLLEFVGANPVFLIFGIGYKTIPAVGVGRAYVGDNNFISTLVECGLVGLVSLIGLLWTCLRGGWLLRRSTDPWTRASGALLVSLWTMHAASMLVVDAMTFWRGVPLLFMLQFALERAGLQRPDP